jgi:hypothetical protein
MAAATMASPQRRSGVRDLSGPNANTLPPGNGMPTIQIEPLRVIGSPSPSAIAAERLNAKISDAFARFDTINVASTPVPTNAISDAPATDPRTDYRLSGAIEYIGDSANAWFTLTSSAEGKVVWSRTFERVQPADAEGVTEDSIVISLTNSLLHILWRHPGARPRQSAGIECRRPSLSLHPGSGRRDPYVPTGKPTNSPAPVLNI